MIDAREFRRALPMLGIKLAREDAEELFASFDEDGSGEIDYKELNKHLRPGNDVDIDDILKAGAAGEIVLEAKNKVALRKGLAGNTSSVFGSANLIDMVRPRHFWPDASPPPSCARPPPAGL